jgi:radical SAM enzyme (TIGR01210 family)
MSSGYPAGDAARERWIIARRPPRNRLDPLRAYAAHVEPEVSESGEPVDVATIFLTNRECPWRCLMCDLWKKTLEESVPPGAIPAQIRDALATLSPARHVKLYNAGSFFDPHAIPPEDHAEIAAAVSSFERVIVESHPSLVGEACLRFRDRIAGRLEVAMGLETVHPDVLPRLNKRMTLERFAEAAAFLRDAGVALRVFVLSGLPFLDEAEGLEATRASIVWGFNHGASIVSVIPTRSGNGALDDLAARSEFVEPPLSALEDAVAFGLGLRRGRVFADLWDLERFRRCETCFASRALRLAAMNRTQRVLPRKPCRSCETTG